MYSVRLSPILRLSLSAFCFNTPKVFTSLNLFISPLISLVLIRLNIASSTPPKRMGLSSNAATVALTLPSSVTSSSLSNSSPKPAGTPGLTKTCAALI